MKTQTLTHKAKEAKVIQTEDGERLICRIRKTQIIIKPEERFRQRLLNHLIDHLGYDVENIGVEVPMTHHKKGESGRADIVVFDKPFREKGSKPLIVIECKNPENLKQVITEYTIEEQVKKYSSVLKPVFEIITNDITTKGLDLRNDKLITSIPSREEIITDNIKYTKSKPYKWVRTPINARESFEHDKRIIKIGYISKVTNKSIIPYYIQLIDLLLDTASSFKTTHLADNFILKEDLKLRLANYGYAGSGGLIGDYRCLLIERPKGKSKIIGYSIYRQGGRGTYLSISVDNRKGLALELQMEKFIFPKGKDAYQIIHNGVMAVGHKGSIKQAVVLDYMAKKAPFLLENGKVVLGTFKLNKHLKFQHEEVQDFILRSATYAILRDELRAEYV